MADAAAGGRPFVQGVGGRLSEPKSAAYLRAVGRVEARATPYVARYMLASDVAYALAAVELGQLPVDVARQLLAELLALLADPSPITADDADVVVAREAWLVDQLGATIGAWVHLGRNRGESLRSYLPRLFFRHVLHEEKRALLELMEHLVDRAEETMEAIAPSYHHLQHAGVTTLGEYLLSWVRTYLPHLDRLDQAAERLGVAPPAMTFRPAATALSARVAAHLGFGRRARIRREAMWSEDQFLEPLWVLVLVNVDLARLAEDLRLWMTQEFGFFQLADRHASGSSALPQKKNPFGLQAVIGGASMGAGRLMAQLSASISPSEESDGLYHAGSLYQHALDVVAWTSLMAEAMQQGSFDREQLRAKAALGWAGASEAHDVLVLEHQVPFRIAHHALGALVRADAARLPLPDLAALLTEQTGKPVEVDTAELVSMVRGERLPATALAIETARSVLAETREQLATSRRACPAMSPTEAAISAIERDARQWLQDPLPTRGGG